MDKFVVDAYAWLEYLNGTEKGKKVVAIIENDINSLFTSSVTLGEVISKFLRMNINPKIALDAINTISSVIDVNQEISAMAGYIHFETKKKNKEFGMLDAFVVATARKINAKILTGDDDFKPFKETLFI